MADSNSIDKYDPNVIIKAANDKLQRENDLEGAQMVFQSALLTWVDDARELQTASGAAAASASSGFVDYEYLQQATATLWLSYAQFLLQAKQYKSATEAYEQALECPVAGTVGRVYLEYARFAQEREKYKTAQKVYLRALFGSDGKVDSPAVTDEQDRELLWMEFLEMMQRNNPDLTLQSLKEAVATERSSLSDTDAIVPESIGSTSTPSKRDASSDADLTTPPPSKRMRLDDANTPPPTESKTHVVTIEPVDEEATAFLEALKQTTSASLPSEIQAAWMVRDGNGPAHAPEPPLFEPSPPKLSDTTAKDLLGIDLSLALIQKLLGPSGTVMLDTCRALWMLQALKEKETNKALDRLDKTMTTEFERLEANLEARLSIAGPAKQAVEQLNQQERTAIQTGSGQQRQQLLGGIAWEFRQLLCVQQLILTKLNVPGFEGPTVEAAALDLQARICSFLHSAFYLRKRIGTEPHVKMLQSQEKRLVREQETGRSLSPVAGTHSPGPGRTSPLPKGDRMSPYTGGGTTPPPPNMQGPPAYAYGQQQQQQQPVALPPPPQQLPPPACGYAQPPTGPGMMMPVPNVPPHPPPMMQQQNPTQYGNQQQQQYPYYQQQQ